MVDFGISGSLHQHPSSHKIRVNNVTMRRAGRMAGSKAANSAAVSACRRFIPLKRTLQNSIPRCGVLSTHKHLPLPNLKSQAVQPTPSVVISTALMMQVTVLGSNAPPPRVTFADSDLSFGQFRRWEYVEPWKGSLTVYENRFLHVLQPVRKTESSFIPRQASQ